MCPLALTAVFDMCFISPIDPTTADRHPGCYRSFGRSSCRCQLRVVLDPPGLLALFGVQPCSVCDRVRRAVTPHSVLRTTTRPHISLRACKLLPVSKRVASSLTATAPRRPPNYLPPAQPQTVSCPWRRSALGVGRAAAGEMERPGAAAHTAPAYLTIKPIEHERQRTLGCMLIGVNAI